VQTFIEQIDTPRLLKAVARIRMPVTAARGGPTIVEPNYSAEVELGWQTLIPRHLKAFAYVMLNTSIFTELHLPFFIAALPVVRWLWAQFQ